MVAAMVAAVAIAVLVAVVAVLVLVAAVAATKAHLSNSADLLQSTVRHRVPPPELMQ